MHLGVVWVISGAVSEVFCAVSPRCPAEEALPSPAWPRQRWVTAAEVTGTAAGTLCWTASDCRWHSSFVTRAVPAPLVRIGVPGGFVPPELFPAPV